MRSPAQQAIGVARGAAPGARPHAAGQQPTAQALAGGRTAEVEELAQARARRVGRLVPRAVQQRAARAGHGQRGHEALHLRAAARRSAPCSCDTGGVHWKGQGLRCAREQTLTLATRLRVHGHGALQLEQVRRVARAAGRAGLLHDDAVGCLEHEQERLDRAARGPPGRGGSGRRMAYLQMACAMKPPGQGAARGPPSRVGPGRSMAYSPDGVRHERAP
jgi:hypothetical protein